MRKNKKTKSIIWMSVIAFAVAVITVLAFVPVKFKTKDYNSFLQSIALSSDLSEGIRVEYSYDTTLEESTAEKQTAVKNTCAKLQAILASNGYVGATTYSVGEDKIVVEMTEPVSASDLTATKTLLGEQGIGCGAFAIKTEKSDTADPILVGSKHVKEVKQLSSSGYYYTVVEFTQEGKDILTKAKADAKASGTSLSYYLYFGDSTELSGDYAFKDDNFVSGALYIGGFESAETAKTYETIVKAGSFDVELQATDTQDITFTIIPNTTLLVLTISTLAVFVAFVVFLCVRYRLLGAIGAVASYFVATLAMFFFCVMPWVEFSASSFYGAMILIAITNIQSIMMFEEMKRQSNHGKTVEASISTGYKKSLPTIIITNCFMVLFGIIIAACFSTALQAIGTIIGVISALALFFNLIFTKGTISLLFNLSNEKPKLFGFANGGVTE